MMQCPPSEVAAPLERGLDHRERLAFRAATLIHDLQSHALIGFSLAGDEGEWWGWRWHRSAVMNAVPDPVAEVVVKRLKERGWIVHSPVVDDCLRPCGSGFGATKAGREQAERRALGMRLMTHEEAMTKKEAFARKVDADMERLAAIGRPVTRDYLWGDFDLLEDIEMEDAHRGMESACWELLRLIRSVLTHASARNCGHPDCAAGWTAKEIAEALRLGPEHQAIAAYAGPLLRSLMDWGMVRRERMVKCPGVVHDRLRTPWAPEHTPPKLAPQDWKVPPQWRHFVHYAQPEEAWHKQAQEAA